MGSFGVEFEKTTLDDIRRSAHVGDIAHQGDAGESHYWICYTNLTATHVEKIWIISHGEMGGPEHHVTNVSATLSPDGAASKDCPALPASMKQVSLDKGLWLNASVKHAHAKVGPPSHIQGHWRSYDFQGKVPGDCGSEGLDLTSWLLLYFDNGHVTSLQVGQVISC